MRLKRRRHVEQLSLYPGRTAGLDVFVTHTMGYLRDLFVGTADTVVDATGLATRRLGVACTATPDGSDEHLLSAKYNTHTPLTAVGLVAPAGRYGPVEGNR